jgi:epoxyqueuosine reductase
VALGNVGTQADLPALAVAARDHEPLIVEHALWAIDRIQSRLASGARKSRKFSRIVNLEC